MAYEFNGTTQYLSVSSAPITALPFTMAAWFNSDSITTTQVILSLDNPSDSIFYQSRIAATIQGFRVFRATTSCQNDNSRWSNSRDCYSTERES